MPPSMVSIEANVVLTPAMAIVKSFFACADLRYRPPFWLMTSTLLMAVAMQAIVAFLSFAPETQESTVFPMFATLLNCVSMNW